MAKTGVITMSLKKLDRLKTVQAVIDRELKPSQAAKRLDLTDRQLRRLVARYRQGGPQGLISKHCGKPSNHQLRQGLEAEVLTIIREHYPPKRYDAS